MPYKRQISPSVLGKRFWQNNTLCCAIMFLYILLQLKFTPNELIFHTE